MPTLKQIVERNDTRLGQAFDLVIQSLIIISLITFSIETLPDLSESTRFWLRLSEVVITIVFTFEYLLRIYVASPRYAYIFSFFGLVDLFAILPFYVVRGVDLRSIRALRLMRLFRIFKLARYTSAIRRFYRAFTIAREEIVLFLSATLVLFFLAAVGIYYFESHAQPEAFGSIFHCLWWAIITLTTVGYGDVYPITVGGRVFTFFLLLIGIGVISVPAGLLASALSKAREVEADMRERD